MTGSVKGGIGYILMEDGMYYKNRRMIEDSAAHVCACICVFLCV